MLLLFFTLAAIHLVVAYHAIIVKFNAILFIIIVIIWMTKHVALLVIRWRLVSLTMHRVIHCFAWSYFLTSFVTLEFLGHLLLTFLGVRGLRIIMRNLIVFPSLLFLMNLRLICCCLLNLSNRDPQKILCWSNSNKGILLWNVWWGRYLRSHRTYHHGGSGVKTHCTGTGVTSIKLFLV